MLGIPSIEFLKDLNIPFEHRSFPKETEKGAAHVARVFGFRERQMVKTLIFETDDRRSALIMVGGDQSVVSSQLKKLLNSRNIGMAKPERVKELTGYQIGSIPPFHWQPGGFPVFLDESLMHEDVLGVGTGIWGEEIFITPLHLVQASHAKIVNLAKKSDMH